MAAHTPQPRQKFLYTIPTTRPGLSNGAKIAIEMGALASRLVAINRTRCAHPDGRPENDAEHSLMLSKVAPELAHALYPELDENLVARFAVLHDDVEAYVGDTPTDTLANLDLTSKEAREREGLKQLVQEYKQMPSYVHLVEQYEAQMVPEARFIRAVDKLMVLLIHFPNAGAVLRKNYTRGAFLKGEDDLILRDGYKYGEFDLIIKLRQELGLELADAFLSNDKT